MTIISDIKIYFIMCEPHCVKVLLWIYSIVKLLDFLIHDTFIVIYMTGIKCLSLGTWGIERI